LGDRRRGDQRHRRGRHPRLGPPSRATRSALRRGRQYPNPGSGESPVFAGAAAYGSARTDIGTIYGSQFTNSGFTLKLAGLRPALYDLVVYARSTVTWTFSQQKVLRLTLAANPRMWTDIPANNATVDQPFTIAGWAIDLAAASGTGVNTLHIWARLRAC
jgi:hypothetical protein